jgi:hypothetical protein
MTQSSVSALGSWSTRLEDSVCGPGLSWLFADLWFPGAFSGVPRYSPPLAVRSGTRRARVAPAAA